MVVGGLVWAWVGRYNNWPLGRSSLVHSSEKKPSSLTPSIVQFYGGSWRRRGRGWEKRERRLAGGTDMMGSRSVGAGGVVGGVGPTGEPPVYQSCLLQRGVPGNGGKTDEEDLPLRTTTASTRVLAAHLPIMSSCLRNWRRVHDKATNGLAGSTMSPQGAPPLPKDVVVVTYTGI